MDSLKALISATGLDHLALLETRLFAEFYEGLQYEVLVIGHLLTFNTSKAATVIHLLIVAGNSAA